MLPSPPIKLWGLVTRQERWGLSRRGWSVIALLFFSLSALLLFRLQPFLAVTHRVDSTVLVSEGWISEYACQTAAHEFRTGSYPIVYATGGPMPEFAANPAVSRTWASVGARRLKSAGVPTNSIQIVPARAVGRDRTYTAAVALRDWFREHNLPLQSINVVTADAHARRTRLLFEKALGKDVAVGIISVPDPDYDPKRWWRYSEGVREVLGEAIAYAYARFFFSP